MHEHGVSSLRRDHPEESTCPVFLGEHLLLHRGVESLLPRQDPHLDEPHRFGLGRVLLRVPAAPAQRHPLGRPRGQDTVIAAQVVGVAELPLDHVGEPFDVPVGMHRPGHTGHQSVIVEHTQRTELCPLRIPILVEREMPPSAEPSAFPVVDVPIPPDLDHVPSSPGASSSRSALLSALIASRRFASSFSSVSSSNALVSAVNPAAHSGKAKVTSRRYSPGVRDGAFGSPSRSMIRSASAYHRRTVSAGSSCRVRGPHRRRLGEKADTGMASGRSSSAGPFRSKSSHRIRIVRTSRYPSARSSSRANTRPTTPPPGLVASGGRARNLSIVRASERREERSM